MVSRKNKPDNTLVIDGKTIPFIAGETVIQAALRAAIYIPHLCFNQAFSANGSCKLCTCEINGRNVSACCTRAEPGMEVKNNTPELNKMRRVLLQMLFVEGNHYCPFCERSGNCQLQAQAYDLGMTALNFPQFNSKREVDASHRDLMLDRNRCIFCELCIKASTEVDKKDIFSIAGRSINKRLVVNSKTGLLKDSTMTPADCAAHICPVGCIIIKREGFKTPIGKRTYDQHPIHDIGTNTAPEKEQTAPISPVSGKPKKKLKLASCSLAGCFGCHMSFLDMDERLVQLLDRIELSRTPFNDIKQCDPDCDLGLIEGGVCNTENIKTLKHFRANCRIIIAVGACAINGGVPALRNTIDVKECLNESYLDGIGLFNPKLPTDQELPFLLEKVSPIHEVIKVDYFLPGCPPPADAFYKIITDLLDGRQPQLPYDLLHFD